MHGLVTFPAAFLETVKQLTAANFERTAEQTGSIFQPMGSPSGQAPATHFWASDVYSPENWALAQQLAASIPGATAHEYDFDTDPGFPERLRADMNLRPIEFSP